MNTLILGALAYMALAPKSSSTGSTTASSSTTAQAPKTSGGGADLAAAFGAFVGGLISAASKDS